MPEDASLDQFASPEPTDSEDQTVETSVSEDADSEAGVETPGEAGGDETGGDEAVEAEGELNSESPDVEAVEPAISTYRWSSEGRECSDCGASAERLWRGDGQKAGGLVCADCKEW